MATTASEHVIEKKVPVKSTSYFDELKQHYREVHARLNSGPRKPPPVIVEPPKPEPVHITISHVETIEQVPITRVEKPPEIPLILAVSSRVLPTIVNCQDVCVAHFNISYADLFSHRRTKSVVLPRQVAMWLSAKVTDHTLGVIGRQFKRDHTTVMHARNMVQKRVDEDPKFAREVANLMDQCLKYAKR